MVNQHIYNWSHSQLLAIGEKSLGQKEYAKAAQYFHTYLAYENDHKTVTDEILFQAGISAYESKKYYPWALEAFAMIQDRFPASKYYRGAKLWTALTHLKQGNDKNFYGVVEEFRLKYRNTQEWEILKGHYEELTQKYK